ncbi:hypothetical protein D3C87_1584810 [compost metagenome]
MACDCLLVTLLIGVRLDTIPADIEGAFHPVVRFILRIILIETEIAGKFIDSGASALPQRCQTIFRAEKTKDMAGFVFGAGLGNCRNVARGLADRRSSQHKAT